MNNRSATAEAVRDDPLRSLAALVIQTLEAQQQYFRSRSFADLGTSKNLEQKLREMATLALAQSTQPRLFADEDQA